MSMALKRESKFEQKKIRELNDQLYILGSVSKLFLFIKDLEKYSMTGNQMNRTSGPNVNSQFMRKSSRDNFAVNTQIRSERGKESTNWITNIHTNNEGTSVPNLKQLKPKLKLIQHNLSQSVQAKQNLLTASTSIGRANQDKQKNHLNLMEEKRILKEAYMNKNNFELADKRKQYQEERLCKQRLKERLKIYALSKLKSGEELKNKNKLIKENIEILKAKLATENNQKKRIIQAKTEIIKKAIEQYQSEKKEFIKNMYVRDLENERALASIKERELLEIEQRLKSLTDK